METHRRRTGSSKMRVLATAALFSLTFVTLQAQDGPKADPPKADTPNPHHDTRPTQTFYLAHAAQANDGNEILTGVRIMVDPLDKLYLDPSLNAIIARASADDLELIARLIKELDRPRKAWRLTYTVIELDNGKRVGVQHTSLVVLEGGRTTVKNGSKIPLATGSSKGGDTQFTYIDVGLNIDASLDALGNGARLRSKIEQSSAVETKTIAEVTEPVIRQSVTEGSAVLVPGKAVTIGSMDIPGSTRHLDIEVLMDPVP
ncbi:secretin N-terminal domain-containing protein [Granulicella tundricola]|uniref:NolW-like domain-containing protein n=1 Tax=Granulicella tundricola (strain ATCC BAA-1859 / DSM 23138 / MP5ACTX9) TaxID=1198114 RepID=E8WX82_GRATM|nr:secretin N-terminal domain-containing protein [Granulicella tundricola]ADW69724.1 hypothetical protein AciX9_2700 [Granulicella tundricola MP5ACTX9]